MPNFESDGWCRCPSGASAGLPTEGHATGEPGCISGPANLVGKHRDEQRDVLWSKALDDVRRRVADPKIMEDIDVVMLLRAVFFLGLEARCPSSAEPSRADAFRASVRGERSATDHEVEAILSRYSWRGRR